MRRLITVLPARLRRGGRGTGPEPLRTRAGAALLSLTGALALLSVVIAAGASRPISTAKAGQQPGSQPATPPAPAGGMYRIVGCRSSGTVAHRGGPPRREVAIGFDDGPWSDTAAFVTMLERAHAQATFFMIGEQVGPQYRATLLRELRNGDVLGDHTLTHPDLALLGAAAVRNQLQQTIARIRGQTGYTPCVFRPPYGAYNASVLSIARSLGLSTIMWNVDPTDWALPGTRAIEQRVLAQVTPGSIIISHDGGGPRGQTLAAYPGIIRALRARGYRIVTINQLLGYRPVYVPCIKLCDGIGVPKKQLPKGAVIEKAP